MIRKFLICGKKQIYMQSKNIETYNEIGKVIELVMPVRDFWDLESLIKDVNYLLAAGEAQAEVATSYRKVLRRSARYAVREMDRTWLYGNKKET
ncbi:MAG: hypothetical protein M3Q07_04140 [Pseudobdellovibrionaceae bacterium]|nr:hypothetical protein [Pseudobdellovibrionaceae bacterium]